MKKFTLFALCLLFAAATAQAQGVYQFPNADFENWDSYDSGDAVPSQWHTFNTMQCDLMWGIGCSTAKTNHSNRITRDGGGYALQMYAKSVLGVIANGAMTTGRTRVKSTDAGNSENYNFDPSGYRWTFNGRPDSISFYARSSGGISGNALFKVFIHDGNTFYDKANGDLQGTCYGQMIIAFHPTSSWGRFVKAVNWSNTTATPQLILGSFSTNEAAGEGSSSDKLDVDALRCIYDKGLASLTIGGVSQSAMLATFNNAEFATHSGLTGSGTNSGTASANCTQLVCYSSDSDFPQVSATKRSSLATSITVSQATISNPKATITVTHNDGSTFVYTINFTNAHQQPATPVIATAGNVHACCATDALTLSVSNAGNNAIQWYRFGEVLPGDTSSSLNVSYESQTAASQTYEYTCTLNNSGCTAASQVYAVTVDYVTPLSSATVAPASICGSGTVTFAATTTANQVVVWKINGIVADSVLVSAGSPRTFTRTFTENDNAGTYTYECYSKNAANSNCHSSVRNVSVTLNAIPTAPTVYSASRCGAGEITIWVSTLDMGDSDKFRWYDSPSGGTPLATVDNYGTRFTTTISQTTHFYVERYNMATGCVSARTEVEARVITSVPMPTATETSVTLCGPDASVELEATPASQTYILWYETAEGEDVAYQGSVMPVWGSEEPSVRTFYAAGHLEGCASERLAFTVTTNAVPGIPEVINDERCGAGEVTLQASGDGTPYWYATQATDEPIATGTTFTTTISQTQAFYVAARSEAGCFGGRSEVYGFVQELPESPLTTDHSYCGTQTVTLEASSNYTLLWFSDEEGTQALNNTEQTVSATTTFYAFAVSPQTSCRSAAAPLTVTIHPVPGVPATAAQVCLDGGRVTLTAEPGTNATGCHWYLPTQDAPVQGTTYTTRTEGNYSVSSYNEHCESAPVQVSVNATPDAPVAAGVERCGAGEVTLNITNQADAASYLWYAQAEGGEPLHTGSAYTIENLPTTTIHYVSALVNGCESPRTAVTATVNPLPAAPTVTGATDVCYGHGTMFTATLSNPSATHCQWFGSPNMITNTYNVESLEEDLVVTVTAVDNLTNCESETVTVNVTVHPIPDAPVVYHDTVCAGSQVVLRAQPQEPELTVRWYANRSATTVLAEGNELRPENLNEGTTTFFASDYNVATGCESGRVPVYAVVKMMPTLPVVANLSYCGTSDAELSIADASNNAHRWYADALGSTLIAEGNSCTVRNVSATTVFYVAANHSGCETGLVPVTVTINDIPATPAAQDDTLCTPGQARLTAYPAQGTVCRWYDIDMLNVGNGSSFTTESLEEGTFIYYVTSYNGETGCESQPATVNVLVAAPLSAPFTMADSICGPGTLYLGARPDRDNVECRWYLNDHLVHTGDRLTIEDATSTATYYVCQHDIQSGCESRKVAVTAKIFPVYNTSFSEIVCDRYTWDDDTYIESGNYTKFFYTTSGCDSTVTLHLTVDSSKTTEFDAVACDEYTWQNDTYTETGDYTKILQTVSGCDSTVTLHLTVNHSTASQETMTLCSDELPLTFHSLTVTEAGSYEVHILNKKGCDSLIHLTVTVHPQPESPVVSDVAKCGAGQNFTLRASVGQNGTVCRWYSTAESMQSVAEGASLELRNVQRDTVVYVSSYNAVTGCESGRVPVRAIVNAIPALPVVDNLEKCGGGTFAFEVAPSTETNITFRWYPSPNAAVAIAGAGSTYAPVVSQTTSYYVESYNAETQCKSDRREVVAMVRDIPATPSFDTYDFCGEGSLVLNRPEAGNYRWYAAANATEPLAGIEQNAIDLVSESVTYYLSTYIDYQSIVCESTQRGALQINVYPVYQPRTLYDTVCQGVAYSNYGHSNLYEQDGNYTVTLNRISSHGCDSLVTLQLCVNPAKATRFAETVCNEYEWNGQTYYETGIYQQTLRTANGCDSTVTLHLTVNNSKRNEFDAVACDEYTWQDDTYTQSGDYTKTLQTVNGCDSTVTLHLIINKSKTFEFDAVACDEYTWNNDIYNESGDYQQTLRTVNGCDSVVTMHLIINKSKTFEFDVVACDQYTWQNDTYTQSGDYTKTLQTVNGCDSTVTLHLIINKSKTFEFDAVACDEYTWNNDIYNESGDYQQTLRTVNGCDSVVTMHLIINKSKTFEFDVVACDQYIWQNDTYTQSGDYTKTMRTVSGCDSVVTMHLVINHPVTEQLQATICLGETYRQNGFDVTPTSAGTFEYRRQLMSAVTGCDSIAVLTMTVNPSYNENVSLTICTSALPYTWRDTLFAANTMSGTYTFKRQTVNGCDSIVRLSLAISHEYRETIVAHICSGMVYAANGFHESATGIYQQRLTAVNGCDSVVELNLTVHEPVVTTLSGTVCQGERYTLNGFDIQTEEAGTEQHQLRLSTRYGCDSIVTLNLTVNPTYSIEENAETCADEPYVWQGHANVNIPTAVGTYTLYDRLATENGCDSIYRLTLTVHPNYSFAETAETCANVSYVWQGHANVSIPTEAGVHTLYDRLATENGCDSIYRLTLTVNEVKTTDLTEAVCQGERYTQNGFDIQTAEAGTTRHERNLRTADGCDSTVTLTLTVNPIYSFEETAETCDNEPYVWQGHANVSIPTVAGVHTLYDRQSTENGCDSIYRLTLTIHPTYSIAEEAEACDNEPYVWQGHANVSIPTEAGVHTLYDRQSTENGCDSIYRLTLTIHPTYSIAEEAEACDNEPYVWQGHANVSIPTEAGVHTLYDRQSTENGCDSIYRLTLTIHPTYSIAEEAEACDNEPYVWQGHANVSIPTEAGVHTLYDRQSTENGCDSIYRLTLTIHPTYSIEEESETCENVPFVWRGHSNVAIPAEVGSYTLYDRLTTENGCDSIHTLNLTVKSVKHKDVYAEICFGDIYTFNGMVYDETGDYSATFTSSAMCDSVVTLHLTVNPVYHIDTAIYICQGALPYAFDTDHVFTQAGNYTVALTSESGCDSVYSIELFVTPYARLAERATVCSDELPYLFKGQSYTQSGVYEITEIQDNGCNVITTLTLTVNPSYKHYDTLTVCQNKMPYLYDANRLLTHAGNDTIHYRTVKGCDSTVIVTLYVQPNPTSSDMRYVCENDLPLQYGGQSISEAGRYEVVFRRADACDSIVTLQVVVYPTYNATENLVLCQSELPYTWRDTTFMEGTNSGNYVFRRTSVNGCDSITTLDLTVNSIYSIVETVEVCEGEPFAWQGHANVTIPTAVGTYTLYDRLSTVNGCDSVHVLNFTVNRAYHFEDTATAREDRPFVWQGHAGVTVPTVAGTHVLYDRLQTAEGCDSVYKLTLTIFKTFYHESSVVTCENELYVWQGHSRIQIPTAPGTYALYDSLLTSDGMDSVYKLTLTVNPVYYTETSAAVCDNEQYVWEGHGNVRIPALPGNYTLYDSLTTVSGCDSVFCLKFTVSPAYLTGENVTVCASETPYLWRGKSLVATGVYYDSLTTASGCDSVYVLRLTVNPSNTYRSRDIELCEGETATWRGRTLTESGIYTDTVSNNYGCFDYYTVNVLVHPSYHIAMADTVCSSVLPYVWHNYTINESGTRTVNMQTADGCDSILTFTLTVLPSYSYTENITVCATETPVVWHGRSLSDSGTYYDSLTTVNGCDSVYRLNLVVNPFVSQADTAVVCDSQLPYLWRGRQLTATGIYTDTVPNSYGCQDRYMLNLTVNRGVVTSIMDTICQGDRYQQNGFDTLPAQYGMVYMQQRLQTTQGCDSTVNLILTVHRSYVIPTVAATCDNVPYEWRGGQYELAGTYYDTLQASTGCDSILVLMLTLNPTYEVLVEDSAMREHAYTNYGLDFTPMEEGDFVYSIQYYTAEGCDSIVKLTLHVAYNYGIDDPDETMQFTIYPNPATTNILIEGMFMEEVFLYNMNGKLVAAKRADSDTNTGLYVGNLPTGYYMLRIRLTDGRTIDKKVMVRVR